MTTSIHVEYVVASFMGPRLDRFVPYDDDRSFFLKKHLDILATLDARVHGITIVNNDCGSEAESTLDILPKDIGGVPLRIIRRPNLGASYGAYAHAIENTPHATHFVLIEDDYVLTMPRFSEWMISKVPEGMLCAAAWPWDNPLGGTLPIAAVFIGMVTAPTIRSALANGWCGQEAVQMDSSYKSAYRNQIAMSQAIIQAGGVVCDWSEEYPTAFWNSSRQYVDFFIDGADGASLVVPLQAMDRNVLIVESGIHRKNPQPERLQRLTWDGRRTDPE